MLAKHCLFRFDHATENVTRFLQMSWVCLRWREWKFDGKFLSIFPESERESFPFYSACICIFKLGNITRQTCKISKRPTKRRHKERKRIRFVLHYSRTWIHLCYAKQFCSLNLNLRCHCLSPSDEKSKTVFNQFPNQIGLSLQ